MSVDTIGLVSYMLGFIPQTRFFFSNLKKKISQRSKLESKKIILLLENGE